MHQMTAQFDHLTIFLVTASGDQTTDGYLNEIAKMQEKDKAMADSGFKLPVPSFLYPKASAEEAEREEREKDEQQKTKSQKATQQTEEAENKNSGKRSVFGAQ